MSSPPRDLLEQGHYARKQIFSRNAIVAWSHGRRFALARELVSARAGGALLDYGCGDGTFVALAHDLFRETVGADIDLEQVRGCAERLGTLQGVRFVSIDALRDPDHRARYDTVACMEVLEHCPSDLQPQVLDDLARLSRPDAVVVISVPIEIGPTRGEAGGRPRAAGAPHEYAHANGPSSNPRMGWRPGLRNRAARNRRDHSPRTTVRFPSQGFNCHALAASRASFTLIGVVFTGAAKGVAHSQVWFVCRNAAPRSLGVCPIDDRRRERTADANAKIENQERGRAGRRCRLCHNIPPKTRAGGPRYAR